MSGPAPTCSHARVYVSVLGDDGRPSQHAQRETTLEGLRSAHGFLQGRIAGELRLKRTPTLEFCYDDTTDRALRVDALIDEDRRAVSATRTRHGEDSRARELVLERLREDTSFVLAAHENPDGDALGSLVAMQGLLTALGKDSAMFISPDDLPLPHEYRFFALEGLIQTPPADIAERTVVFLDCGNIDRNSASVLRDGRTC